MSKKKVLIVQRQMHHYRRRLFEYLQENGSFDLAVAHTGTSEDSNFEELCFPRIKKNLNAFNKQYDFFYSGDLTRYIKENHQAYSAVVLEGTTNILQNLAVCGYLRKHGSGYLIWDAGRRRGAHMTPLRWAGQPLVRQVLRGANGVIAYSNLAKTYFTGVGVDPQRVFVCQNTINTSSFEAEMREITPAQVEQVRASYAPNGERILLYVGAVEERKRVPDLIEAFQLLRDAGKPVVLVIIGGGGYLPHLEKMVAGAGAGIHLTGPIIDGVLPYFMAADVFCLPSEGGLSLNQAMMCGKPLVASSADGTELDLIQPGVNGYLFDEGNARQMADCISKICEADETIRAMGAASRKKVEEDVNEQNFLRCFEAGIAQSIALNGKG